MATPIWPSELPGGGLNNLGDGFSRQGFDGSAPDNLIRSENDAGPEKRRRRSTAGYEPLRGTMVMTGAERTRFLQFFRTDLYDGALAFTFPDPYDDDQTVLVSFRRPPSWTALGGDIWRMTLDLQIQPSLASAGLPTADLSWSFRGATSELATADTDWIGSRIVLDATTAASRTFTYNEIPYQVQNFVAGERASAVGKFMICSLIQRLDESNRPLSPADYTFDAVALASLGLRFRLVHEGDTNFRRANAVYSNVHAIGAGYYCLIGSQDLSFLTQWRALYTASSAGSRPEMIVDLFNV